MESERYPTDLKDEEWALIAGLFTKSEKRGKKPNNDMRRIVDGCFYLLRGGIAWRMMPHDLPAWPAVYQQTRRWLAAGVFEAIVHDLRVLLRLAAGRAPEPTAAIFDSRTMQSTPESGAGAGYDGAKRRKGRKLHPAVEELVVRPLLHDLPVFEHHDQIGVPDRREPVGDDERRSPGQEHA